MCITTHVVKICIFLILICGNIWAQVPNELMPTTSTDLLITDIKTTDAGVFLTAPLPIPIYETSGTSILPSVTFLPAAPETAPLSSDTLNLTIEGAIVLALENNPALVAQTINPQIMQTYESGERALFDPMLSTAASIDRSESTINNRLLDGDPKMDSTTYQESISAGLSKYLPTGTQLDLSALGGHASDDGDSRNSGNPDNFGLELSIVQHLLQGRGIDVNLVGLRQARLETLRSDYELRAYTEALVADVENAYWDLYLAKRRLELYKKAVDVAQMQVDDVETRIEVGRLAPTERYAALAELARRRESLIDSSSDLQVAKLKLLQLLTPTASIPADREIQLLSEPAASNQELLNAQAYIDVALKMRPDLNETRLGILHNDLQLVRTKNGLLPTLDLFARLGGTGYSDSFAGTIRDFGNGNQASVGLEFSYALGNRAAQAAHRRSELTQVQTQEAFTNMQQLAEFDVRSALIEAHRVYEQITATRATLELQMQTFYVEREKFYNDRSTVLFVSQTERDLVDAALNNIEAIVLHLKSFVQLYRADGSLLIRRGVSCPGDQPVSVENEPIMTSPLGE